MTPTGPRALTGSAASKRRAAVILEVLSGIRSAAEGSRALKISPGRYYTLETQALQAMLKALESRRRGRQRKPEDEIRELRKENDRLGRELTRALALVRAAQRSLGLPAPESRGKKGRRRGPKTSRGQRTVAVLKSGAEDPPKKRTGGVLPEDGEVRQRRGGP